MDETQIFYEIILLTFTYSSEFSIGWHTFEISLIWIEVVLLNFFWCPTCLQIFKTQEKVE